MSKAGISSFTLFFLFLSLFNHLFTLFIFYFSSIPYSQSEAYLAEGNKALNRTTIFGFGKAQKYEGKVLYIPLYLIFVKTSWVISLDSYLMVHCVWFFPSFPIFHSFSLGVLNKLLLSYRCSRGVHQGSEFFQVGQSVRTGRASMYASCWSL